MSVLSKLNLIEICQVSVKESKQIDLYGLYCSCCKQFITNAAGFSFSVSKLLDTMQIAAVGHYRTDCKIKQNGSDSNDDDMDLTELLPYTPMCFDPNMSKN